MYNAEIIDEYETVYKYKGLDTHYYAITFVYSNQPNARVVEGIAICKKQDKYNFEFGKNLAKTKAYEALYHEVKKLMIAETHRPEWKKKQKMSFEGKTAHLYGIDGFEITKDINRIGKEMAKKFGKGKSVKVTVEEI